MKLNWKREVAPPELEVTESEESEDEVWLDRENEVKFKNTLVYLKTGTRNCHVSSTQEERRSKTGAHQ